MRNGLVRQLDFEHKIMEGKDYIVRDGDILSIRVGVG
jgi:ribosome-binding ATPase YchF (GTP1/OBG family)